jgi:hypothetical protein
LFRLYYSSKKVSNPGIRRMKKKKI